MAAAEAHIERGNVENERAWRAARTAEVAVERVRALHSPAPGWEREWKDPAEALAEGWPLCAGLQDRHVRATHR